MDYASWAIFSFPISINRFFPCQAERFPAAAGLPAGSVQKFNADEHHLRP